MIIKFATVCDMPNCKEVSAEYSTFPTCRECGRDVCYGHQATDSLNEEQGTAICNSCASEVTR
jgi:hypothetical protein